MTREEIVGAAWLGGVAALIFLVLSLIVAAVLVLAL